MSTDTTLVPGRLRFAPWQAFALGWLVMFGLTYRDLAGGIWQTDDDAHGALVLLVLGWMVWEQRQRVFAAPARPRNGLGAMLLAAGLLMYAVGRSQHILLLEIGSQIPVAAGGLLIVHGASALRALWFPLFYLVFMIPVPGVLIDSATGPLKLWISGLVADGLFALGYPVAHQGVMLTVGQYQLLVADACSGLHSMLSLTALGFLYLYLVRRRSWLHNAIVIAAILPIAFVANVLRVTILALVTWYLGDAAGQGFLHGFAGMALMLAAVACLVALDGALVWLIRPRGAARSAGVTA